MQIDEQKLRSALNEKTIQGGTGQCGVCGRQNWTYDTRVYELREFTGGGMIVGPSVAIIPCIVMTCGHCGNMNILNAVALGVVDKTGRPT